MDDSRVTQLAARHVQQLQEARATAARSGAVRPQDARRQYLRAQWPALDTACRAYVAAYNEAFGSERLVCHNHEHGLNVEIADDDAWAMRLHVDPQTGTVERALVEGRRFSETWAVALESLGRAFSWTLDGAPLEPDDLVVRMLDRLTERATEAQCAQM